jgi:hypothetical protein
MTPKEAPFGTPMEELRFLQRLERIGNAFWLRFEYIAQSLTELEELKRDVKSVYTELIMYIGNNLVIEQEELDINYLCEVVEKLSKVGKEE